MKKSTAICFGVIIALLLSILWFVVVGFLANAGRGKNGTWTSGDLKTYAQLLEAKAIPTAAIAVYEQIIAQNDLPKEELARVAYQLGSMHMKMAAYEKALGA